jgi:DNA-binding IclR family transcriptional regulator
MGTVTKALELLDLFSRARPLIGLSDLARLAELNKATCFRLLTELANYGLVEQVGSAREYRLGPAVLRLSALREAHVPMRDAAMPVLQALAQSTGETAHMSLLLGTILRPLAVAYSAVHSTRVSIEDTDMLPFHATSSGLAVLAFQPEPFTAKIVAGPLLALTPLTETDPARLCQKLAVIRATGIAESAGGFEAEVHSLAVPLFDALGRCSGAVAVAGLTSRMTESQIHLIRSSLLRAGAQITQLWGGTAPPAIAHQG